jgi:hypothetical protein
MLISQQKQRQQLRILATATAKVTIDVIKCLAYKVNAITYNSNISRGKHQQQY